MIWAYVTPPGSKIPRGLLRDLSSNMKDMMGRACDDIPFATFKDDRCEGRIVTKSDGDIRPIMSFNGLNPVIFRLHSTSPCIPSDEMKIIRDAIYKQMKEFLGYDFDIFILLCD